MENRPKPNQIYKHFKGNNYKVLCIAKHSETGEELVIYQALYGDNGIYARPLDMFVSSVDREKYPEVTQRKRFELTDMNENSSSQIDERLAGYLDADTYGEKLEILVSLRNNLDEGLIRSMAMAVDVELPEAPLEKQYEELKYCLSTKERFEGSRLR